MNPVRATGIERGGDSFIERGIFFPQDVTCPDSPSNIRWNADILLHQTVLALDSHAGVCSISLNPCRQCRDSLNLVSLSRTSCLVLEITLKQPTSVQCMLVHYKRHWSTLNSFSLITRSSRIHHITLCTGHLLSAALFAFYWKCIDPIAC
jgi:hypothetical protein